MLLLLAPTVARHMSYYYSYTLTHSGLGRSRVIKASTQNELQQQVAAQNRIWNELYARQREADLRRQEKANKAAHLEQAQDEAENWTKEARQVLTSIRTTLATSVGRRLSFSWDDRRNHLPYPAAQPEVTYHDFPVQPQATDPAFMPHFGMLDKLVGPFHDKKVAEAQQLYQEALSNWGRICAQIGQSNDRLEADYLARIQKWKTDKHAFEQAQTNALAASDLKLQRYKAGNAPEVIEFNTKILEQSTYPDFFEKSFDLDYNGVKRVLIVNYDLPAFFDFPKRESVKYVKAKDSFTESTLSAKAASELYASFVFQVCLRTVQEILVADITKVINGVAFNGYVSATNPATGHVDRTCILALNTTPGAFAPLNLTKVDPEECFQALGGLSSDPLQKYRAVTPASAEASQTSSESGWIATLKQRITQAGGTAVFQVKDLQLLIGSIPGSRANLGDSRSLITLLAEGGYAVEPDASLLAQSYRPTDAIALYVPQNSSDLRTSSAYQGAVAILAMCALVAVADSNPEPYEVDRTWQCVQEAFKLSPVDATRFNALLKALVVNRDCLWRSLPKVVSQLKPEFKEWAVEVAVYVGIKNGALEKAEREVLERIFQVIDLPAETSARIIAKYTASSPEVTVLHADPQPVGEVIKGRKGGLKLDMSRVAAIAQETKEVVAKLSSIMEDKEAKAEAPPAANPVVAAPSDAISVLNPNYLPLYHELIAQSQWSKADFNKLAAKYNLMPVAVTDVINGWADDALGDFLIEGEDPVTIHTELLPQAL
jgi:tellurite resistance protein